MPVRQASIDSFIEERDSGRLKGDREQVFYVVSHNDPMTCGEITQRYFFGKQRNDIHSRRTELKKEGRIHELFRRPCEISGKSVAVFAVGQGDGEPMTPPRPTKREWGLFLEEVESGFGEAGPSNSEATQKALAWICYRAGRPLPSTEEDDVPGLEEFQ